jgi:hypothetical protein
MPTWRKRPGPLVWGCWRPDRLASPLVAGSRGRREPERLAGTLRVLVGAAIVSAFLFMLRRQI